MIKFEREKIDMLSHAPLQCLGASFNQDSINTAAVSIGIWFGTNKR